MVNIHGINICTAWSVLNDGTRVRTCMQCTQVQSHVRMQNTVQYKDQQCVARLRIQYIRHTYVGGTISIHDPCSPKPTYSAPDVFICHTRTAGQNDTHIIVGRENTVLGMWVDAVLALCYKGSKCPSYILAIPYWQTHTALYMTLHTSTECG